jgi:hypothetical protein
MFTKEELEQIGILSEQAMKHKIKTLILNHKLDTIKWREKNDDKISIEISNGILLVLDLIISDIDKIKEGKL